MPTWVLLSRNCRRTMDEHCWLTCSATFFIYSRPTSPWVMPPMTGWAFLHQLSTKKIPHIQLDGGNSIEVPSVQVCLGLGQVDSIHGTYLAYDNSSEVLMFKCHELKHPPFMAIDHQQDQACIPIPILAYLASPRFLERGSQNCQHPSLSISLFSSSPKLVVGVLRHCCCRA